MLYERWRQISSDQRQRVALRETASGRRWTFGELGSAGEAQPARAGESVFAQGHTAEFILDVLAAWRDGKILCPLEPGQAPLSFPKPPASCVHLKATSATTGPARLVAFTAEQLAADATNIVETMGLRGDWPNLGVISMAHSYGFSNLVLPLLLHGIPLVLLPAPLPEMMRRAAAEEETVTLAAVPAMWRAWADAAAIPKNVGLAISAGAPLPLPLEQEVFSSTGLKIHNFYGASECGGIAFDSSATPRHEAACVGSPMRHVNLSRDSHDCLVVRSGAVGTTYWPETSPALSSAEFRTSDVIELKNDLVFLRGRIDDQMNVAGRKLAPEKVEQALLAHPCVRECLVLGMPDPGQARADTIVAVIVGKVAESELRQFLSQSLPAWQIPRQWKFVESLATNARGKISRAEWRRRLAFGSSQIKSSQIQGTD